MDMDTYAAPSGTTWGKENGSSNKMGRIGIKTTFTDTTTTREVKIQIYLWIRYRCQDSSNNFKYSWSSSPNINIGSKNVNTTSNSSWSTSNQILIAEFRKTYNKASTVTTGHASANYSSIEYAGGSGSVSVSFQIPALPSYTVSYNANGGSGAPASQSKTYGATITLSSSKPTKSGFTFLGWGTSQGDTSVDYNPGSKYSANANITLYAIWTANYVISYDANGGYNAPSNQTKQHGVNITLSRDIPTRQNYTFKGWSTSSTSSFVTYNPGDTYSSNSSIVLYAVWEINYLEPRIINLKADRCNSTGTLTEEGTCALVTFNWYTDVSVNSITIQYRKADDSYDWNSTTVYASGTSGSVSKVIEDYYSPFDVETDYDIRANVTDYNGMSNFEDTTLQSIKFEMDFLYGGGGVSIGAPAKDTGFNVHYDTTFEKPVRLKQSLVAYPDTYVDIGDINQPIGCGYFSDVYINGKSHTKNTLLWSGGHFMTTDQTATLSEPISKQAHGIILVFTPYVDNATKTYDRNTFYIPKELIAMHNGQSMLFTPTGSMPGNIVANKCLFIFDNKITGHSQNAFAGQVSGSNIYIQNNKFVLQYVIGI